MVLAKRTRKSTQVCETRTCVRTCDGWPNEFVRKFAQLVAKTRKFHAYTVELRSACVDLRWVTKQWKPGVRRLAYEFQSKTLTCIDLRVRPFGQRSSSWVRFLISRFTSSPSMFTRSQTRTSLPVLSTTTTSIFAREWWTKEIFSVFFSWKNAKSFQSARPFNPLIPVIRLGRI